MEYLKDVPNLKSNHTFRPPWKPVEKEDQQIEKTPEYPSEIRTLDEEESMYTVPKSCMKHVDTQKRTEDVPIRRDTGRKERFTEQIGKKIGQKSVSFAGHDKLKSQETAKTPRLNLSAFNIEDTPDIPVRKKGEMFIYPKKEV